MEIERSKTLKYFISTISGILIAIFVGLISLIGLSKALFYIIDIEISIGTVIALGLITILICIYCGWITYKQTIARTKKRNG